VSAAPMAAVPAIRADFIMSRTIQRITRQSPCLANEFTWP
jgi:hypothetical protein